MNSEPAIIQEQPVVEEPTEEIIPIIGTEEESSGNICWSPRFEFDAPRYTNFSSKKYRETRRLLNKLVLNQDPEGTETEDDKESIVDNDSNNMDTTMTTDNDLFMWEVEDSSEIDEWFDRFHPLHEPLRPSTPPGPLISPEKRALGILNSPTSIFRPQSLKASPLKLDFSSDLPSKASPMINTALNTPSKGPNTRIGLRSKPARVLKPNGSSFNSSPVTTTTSASSPKKEFTTVTGINSSPSRTPVRLSSARDSVTRLSNARESNTRLSNASSSITLSVSSLTKTFYNNDLLLSSPNKSPTRSPIKSQIPNSPLRMKTKFSEGTASPLRTAVGILQLDEPQEPVNFKKRLPAQPENTPNSVQPLKPVKKQKIEVELEDIKKLLSQHNNRIRPHNHHHTQDNNSNNKRKT